MTNKLFCKHCDTNNVTSTLTKMHIMVIIMTRILHFTVLEYVAEKMSVFSLKLKILGDS